MVAAPHAPGARVGVLARCRVGQLEAKESSSGFDFKCHSRRVASRAVHETVRAVAIEVRLISLLDFSLETAV